MNDQKTPKPAITDAWACPYNDAVSCSPCRRNCFSCGWNTAVAKDRLNQLCKKLGIQVPQATAPAEETISE